MKFEISVRDKDGGGEPWMEQQDRPEVTTLAQAEEWGRMVIANFNASLQPHEREREFLSAAMTGEESDIHEFFKVNLVTVSDSHGMYDAYRCENCGVTGKRRSLEGAIVRDSQFMAPSYASCAKAKVLMERKRKRREDA